MEITPRNLWDEIAAHAGETMFTASNLPFTYTIQGGEFFTDRKKKSITRATFEKAFEKLQLDFKQEIVGPKTLNVFGAPYVWAVFVHLGIVDARENQRIKTGGAKGQMSFLDEMESAELPERTLDKSHA